MKKTLLSLISLFCLLGILVGCGPAAPAGMYAPEEADSYIPGVSGIRFALPETYQITMSTNMLAGVGTKGDSFSLQCRHSNYRYADGLQKNYEELKKQLVGQYGDFGETLTEIPKKEENPPMLRSDYELKVAGKLLGYTQYLFYDPSGEEFFIFTYTYDVGKREEELLLNILDTLEFEESTKKKELPSHFRWVENKEADSLKKDRYALYCPDGWIWDNTLGASTMKIPSAGIITNFSLYEIPVGSDYEQYVEDYMRDMAPDMKDGKATPTEKYVLASLCRMNRDFQRFTLYSAADAGKKADIHEKTAIEKKSEYLQKYTSPQSVTFTYVEFSAKMPSHSFHDQFVKGGTEEDLEKFYRFRQYFVEKDGILYLFTYTAENDEHFEKYKDDISKIIDNFSFIEAKA